MLCTHFTKSHHICNTLHTTSHKSHQIYHVCLITAKRSKTLQDSVILQILVEIVFVLVVWGAVYGGRFLMSSCKHLYLSIYKLPLLTYEYKHILVIGSISATLGTQRVVCVRGHIHNMLCFGCLVIGLLLPIYPAPF